MGGKGYRVLASILLLMQWFSPLPTLLALFSRRSVRMLGRNMIWSHSIKWTGEE
jgi:hypothetical protein